MKIAGNLLNLFDRTIRYGQVTIERGRIHQIDDRGAEWPGEPYLLPGFVDAHVHIESSLLTPVQFARMAVVHGTVATVSDPHEIGNVLGVAGVEYMIADGRRTPFKFCFGAPSCVPATSFETAGATISVAGIRQLLAMEEIGYLAEVMNFPGVLQRDEAVMAKIAAAKAGGKPVDGHAPGLRGTDAQRYIDAGIETDHECFTYEEAADKIQRGMHVLIREGSAARNFETLIPLLADYGDKVMFCSDDKHPDNLVEGHINRLVGRALAKGYDRFDVLRAACLNPVRHYHLPVGLLRVGDPADFIVVRDWEHLVVEQTWINGEVVAENGVSQLPDLRSEHVNRFAASPKSPPDFTLTTEATGLVTIRVIEALDGQLITRAGTAEVTTEDGILRAAPERDLLKIVVVNRYRDGPPAVAFVRNFGLQRGAIASSVAHDSHNVIAVGCDDESIAEAVNRVIEVGGGISAAVAGMAGEPGGGEKPESEKKQAPPALLLPLPIAGLMTDDDGYRVARQYTAIDRFVKDELGCTLTSPFMTLSFMALLVIPSLKVSDLGLFDGENFRFTTVIQ